jgi:hypothetical protein
LIPTPCLGQFQEAQTRLTYRRLPPTFEQNQGRTDSRMRFLLHSPDVVLYTATRTAELRGKEKYAIGSAPSKWWRFAPTYSEVPHQTTFSTGNLEHYGLRIPWAGSIILRIGKQAKAHPHITRLLTALKPRL